MKKIYIATLTIFALDSAAFAGVGGFMHGHSDQHWESPASAKKVKNPVNATRRSVNKGEVLFMNSCASCHGNSADGQGYLSKSLSTEPTNLKAMSGMHPDGDFAWKIANGNGVMPAWKDTIKQRDIWNLVNYIQSLSPNKNTAASMGHSESEHSMMDMKGMSNKNTAASMGHSESEHSMMDMKGMGLAKTDMKGIDHSETTTVSHANIIQKIEHNDKAWYDFW